MTAQETVNQFAALAAARLGGLLRLSTAQHVFDATPGAAHSESLAAGVAITLDRWKRDVQPYKDLERFVSEERVMRSVIDPGLLPIAKALSCDVLGRKILLTRRVAPKKSDRGVIAHVEGYGIRIALYLDSDTQDTIVAWECLYGLA